MNKICPRCKEKKELSSFGLRSTGHSKDGLAYNCKSCVAKSAQRDRTIHRERYRRQQMKFQSSPKGIYKILKRKVKFYGKKSFDIDQDAFIEWYETQPKVCHYCEIPEKIWQLVGKVSSCKRLTIDRKDSHIGYKLDNIVLACWRCNITKNEFLSEWEMLEIGEKYIKPKWQSQVQSL